MTDDASDNESTMRDVIEIGMGKLSCLEFQLETLVERTTTSYNGKEAACGHVIVICGPRITGRTQLACKLALYMKRDGHTEMGTTNMKSEYEFLANEKNSECSGDGGGVNRRVDLMDGVLKSDKTPYSKYVNGLIDGWVSNRRKGVTTIVIVERLTAIPKQLMRNVDYVMITDLRDDGALSDAMGLVPSYHKDVGTVYLSGVINEGGVVVIHHSAPWKSHIQNVLMYMWPHSPPPKIVESTHVYVHPRSPSHELESVTSVFNNVNAE